MSYRSTIFSYYGWNLGNSEISEQKMCIYGNLIYSYFYGYNKIQAGFSKRVGERLASVIIYEIRIILFPH
jgi:hypothetical protein